VTGKAVASATPSTPAPQHKEVMELARTLGGKVRGEDVGVNQSITSISNRPTP
jgi:hypothetical protein